MSDEKNTEQSDQLDQSEQQDGADPEQRATDGTGMIWVIAFAVLILAMVLASPLMSTLLHTRTSNCSASAHSTQTCCTATRKLHE